MDLFCLLGKSFNGMDSHHDYYPMGKGPPTLTLIYGRKLGSYPQFLTWIYCFIWLIKMHFFDSVIITS